MTTSAHKVLDQVHTLAQLEALEAAPDAYAAQLADDIPREAATLYELEQCDAALAAALALIDTAIARAMRIRLEHALAADTSIGSPTRSVFASTIVGYAHNLPLLEQRAHQVAARGGAKSPELVAETVCAAARSVLALRDTLRRGVLALIRDRASSVIAGADRRARDRSLDEVQRKRWSAVRRDQESLAADPERILISPLPARLAALSEQLDEPEAEPERSFADLIEMD